MPSHKLHNSQYWPSMSDSVRKAHRLDRSYIITQTEITRALWPFPRTAANVYQNIRHKALHNSLFCHENAEGYSTVEEDGELMCYCRRVASLFQKYGIRSDLHAIDHQKRKVSLLTYWFSIDMDSSNFWPVEGASTFGFDWKRSYQVA